MPDSPIRKLAPFAAAAKAAGKVRSPQNNTHVLEDDFDMESIFASLVDETPGGGGGAPRPVFERSKVLKPRPFTPKRTREARTRPRVGRNEIRIDADRFGPSIRNQGVQSPACRSIRTVREVSHVRSTPCSIIR